MVEMEATPYIERVLTPEASLEVSQHVYNLETHRVLAKALNLADFEEEEGDLEGFDDIDDPLKEK
eukprot:5139916-Ditylum_brightwellii.AAC.1